MAASSGARANPGEGGGGGRPWPRRLAIGLAGAAGLLGLVPPAAAQLNCNVGIEFYPGGAIRRCVLNGHHRLHTARGQALTCADGHAVLLYEDGRLQRCTLQTPFAAGGVTCGAGRVVTLAPDGTMTACEAPSAAGDGDETWHYTLGQERRGQQANLCRDRAVALEVARVFSTEGARAGYAALDRAPACETRVGSFTPRAVLATVPVRAGAADAYAVRFVEVVTAAGQVEVLVTTREVVP